MKLKLALLTCRQCGVRGLVVVDADNELTRITDNKCHNRWTKTRVFDVDIPAEFAIHEECPVHSYSKHGEEANELRNGIQRALKEEDFDMMVDDLRRLLDDVDARDSLAYLERKSEVTSADRERAASCLGETGGQVKSWVKTGNYDITKPFNGDLEKVAQVIAETRASALGQ